MEASPGNAAAAPPGASPEPPAASGAPGRRLWRAVLLPVLIIALLVRLARRRLQAGKQDSETGPDSTSGGSLS